MDDQKQRETTLVPLDRSAVSGVWGKVPRR